MSAVISVNGEVFHWQLPMASEENNNTGYIHGNAKPHLFGEDGWCLCHSYWQDVTLFEDIENIDGSDMVNKRFCKSCSKKLLSLKDKELEHLFNAISSEKNYLRRELKVDVDNVEKLEKVFSRLATLEIYEAIVLLAIQRRKCR